MSDGIPTSARSALRPTLSRGDVQLKELFGSLRTTADVASLLEIPPKQLTHILWRTPGRARYTTYAIKKRRGGMRVISAPTKSIKILQQKLLTVLSLVARPRDSVHGFRNQRSILTNAACHTKKAFILNVDLKDFFPSINFGRVRGMFTGKPYCIGERAATCLAQLCCHEGALPQGAPTSPIVSTMVCARMDGQLQRLAKHTKCVYTRYADDLTFSTHRRKFPKTLATWVGPHTETELGPELRRAIEEENGFAVNLTKVRLQSKTVRQEVTGLTVNRRPNIPRRFSARIRAMLHAWEKHGYEAAQEEFCERYDTKHRWQEPSKRHFEAVIKGKLAFLKSVRGQDNAIYIKLNRQLHVLLGDAPDMQHNPTNSREFDVFVCHASEDKEEVVVPLVQAMEEAGIKVWWDKGQIGWGDSLPSKINQGLSRSRFIILVLSKAFINKSWPEKEMNTAINIETSNKKTVVLPLLFGSRETREKLRETYPLALEKTYKVWSKDDLGAIISEVKSMLLAS